jgi:hypothetical protein
VEHLSNWPRSRRSSKVGALIGLGFEGEDGMAAGAEAGAEQVAAAGGVHVFTEQEGWDVLEDAGCESSPAWPGNGREDGPGNCPAAKLRPLR